MSDGMWITYYKADFGNMQKVKVLVVDDDATIVNLLSEMLVLAGNVEIDMTTDPHEAINIYREKDFNVVLLDVNMPELSGFKVLKTFSEIEKANRPKVIFLTGHQEVDIEQQVVDSGADGILTKPFRLDTLRKLINSCEPSAIDG